MRSPLSPDAVIVPSLLVATTDTRHYIDLTDDQYRFQGIRVASGSGRIGARHQ